MMGIVGAGLILVWAASLARKSGSVLLVREGAESLTETDRGANHPRDGRSAPLSRRHRLNGERRPRSATALAAMTLATGGETGGKTMANLL